MRLDFYKMLVIVITMYGTIFVNSLEEVATFLAAFSKTDSTDVFEVRPSGRGYRIDFAGGK